MTCIAKFDYFAKQKGVLSFRAGNVITLNQLSIDDVDWLSGTNGSTGETGKFPKNYTIFDDYIDQITSTQKRNKKQERSFKVNSIRLKGQLTKLLNLNSAFSKNFSSLPKNEEKKLKLTKIKELKSQRKLPFLPIFQEGFLLISEKTGQWNKRYARLNNKSILLYKKDQLQTSTSCIGEVDLTHLISIRITQFENPNLEKKINCFELIFGNKIIFLQANSTEEVQMWINTIRLVQLFIHIASRTAEEADKDLIILILNYLEQSKLDYNNNWEHIKIELLQTKLKQNQIKSLTTRLQIYKRLISSITEWEDFLILKLFLISQLIGDLRSKCCVMKDYNSDEKSKLNLKKFDLISVIEAHQDEWWLGEVNGIVGWFSIDNVVLLCRPDILINQNDNNKNDNNQKENNKNENISNIIDQTTKTQLNDRLTVTYEEQNPLNEMGIEYHSYLMKQLLKKNKWKKRFFHLINNYLNYYVQEDSTHPNLIINLSDINRVENVSVKLNKENCFEVINTNRQLILNIDDNQIFNDWMDTIQLALNARDFLNPITFEQIDEQEKKINLLLNYVNDKLNKIRKNYLELKKEKLKIENEDSKLKLKKIDKKQKKLIKINCKRETSYKPYFLSYGKILITQERISTLERYKNQLLSILARLCFPNIDDQEVAYSIQANIPTLMQDELTFEKNQWFMLMNEVDENYLQVETGNEIGLAPRNKLKIIKLPKIGKIFIIKKENNLDPNNDKETNNQEKNNEIHNNNNNKSKIIDNINKDIILKKNRKIKKQKKTNNVLFSAFGNFDNKKFKNKNKNKRSHSINIEDNKILIQEYINLYQEVLLEEKSGQSYPIYKEGFLKIIKRGNKSVKRHIRLKSWYFGIYENENQLQPINAIDFRNVTLYDFDSQSQKGNQFKVKIKGGLSQTFVAQSHEEVIDWLTIFNICKLFQELSQPIVSLKNKNKKQEEEIIFQRNQKYVNLINWINTEKIENQKKYDQLVEIEKKQSLQKTNQSQAPKNSLKRKNSKQNLMKIQLSPREMKRIQALLNTWRKRLLSKAARLNISDRNDNDIRVFCKEDYDGVDNRSELSFKKNEWLILIQKPINGILKAKKGNHIGTINANLVELVIPSKPELETENNQEGSHINGNSENKFGKLTKRHVKLTRKISLKRNKAQSLGGETPMLKQIYSPSRFFQLTKRLLKLNLNQTGKPLHETHLPIFTQIKVLKETSTGSKKWKKKIFLINEWGLYIFSNKKSLDLNINLKNLISLEKCSDLIDHPNSFILNTIEHEIRFVVNSKMILNQILNDFQIIKNILTITSPICNQSYLESKATYFKIIKWVIAQIRIEEKRLHMMPKNKNNKEYQEEIEFIDGELLILEDWKKYLLSRICRLKILSNLDPNCKYFNKNQLIEDNRKRICCLENNNNNNIQENVNELIYNKYDIYLFHKTFQSNSDQIVEVFNYNNDLKKIIKNVNMETIIPEKLNTKFEFDNNLLDKNGNENIQSNSIGTIRSDSSSRSGIKISRSRKSANIIYLNNTNIDFNGNNDGDNANKEQKNNQDSTLFDKFFNVNQMTDKEVVDLAENCLNRWEKEPENIFNFPIYYSNMLSFKNKLNNQWGSIVGWLLFIYKSNKDKKPFKVFNLRTINEVRIVSNEKYNEKKNFHFILKQFNNVELKFYTKNDQLLDNWTKIIRMMKNFTSFISENGMMENSKIKLIRYQSMKDWIYNQIIKFEKEKNTQETLLENFMGNKNSIQNHSHIQKSVENLNRKLICLYSWRKRILIQILQINYNYFFDLDLDFIKIGYIHNSCSGNEQKNNNNNNKNKYNNNNNNNNKENYDFQFLDLKKNDWVIYLNDTRKGLQLDNYFHGINLKQFQNINLTNNNNNTTDNNSNIDQQNTFNLNYLNQNDKVNKNLNQIINSNKLANGLILEKNVWFFTKREILDIFNINFNSRGKSTTNKYNQGKFEDYDNYSENESENNNFNFFSTSQIESDLLNEMGSLPIFYEGEIWKLKNGIRTKWQKKFIRLNEFNLFIYSNPNKNGKNKKKKRNEFLELNKTLSLENEFQIDRIKDEKEIPLSSSLSNSVRGNVFEIKFNHKSYKFGTEDAGTRFEWLYHLKTINNFKVLLQPPEEGKKRELDQRIETIDLLLNYLMNSIEAIKKENDDESKLFKIYNEKPNQYVDELVEIEKKIQQNEKLLEHTKLWKKKCLELLLRIKIGNDKNNDYEPRAYLLTKIKDHNSNEILLIEKQFVKIVEQLKNGVKVTKNEKIIYLNNNQFIKVLPAPKIKFKKSNSANNNHQRNPNLNKRIELLDTDVQKDFEELLIGENLMFAQLLLKIINISDVEILTRQLPLILEPRNLNMDLLALSIVSEVDKTIKETTLFRGNSKASKLMTQYAFLIGMQYLKKVIRPIVIEMMAIEGSFEINKSKLKRGEILSDNQERLKKYSYKMINSILDSILYCPLILRDLASILCTATESKFPNSKYILVAGFIFLRFFSPSISLPEALGITDQAPTPKVRRGLVLISKVLQAVANRNAFKETELHYLNSLVKDLEPKVIKFMEQLIEPIVVTNTTNNEIVTILAVKDDQNLIVCKGRKLSQTFVELNIDDLDLNLNGYDYIPETFDVKKEKRDQAFAKVFKLLKIEKIQNSIFDSLKNHNILLQQFQKLLEKEKFIQNQKNNENNEINKEDQKN
ncbi:ras gtpase-activating protein [Anaeramoeba flamelloides]|uniref:Ras gtpase-activating protein n=1 Tax=Anaeramoeba flamelloides TaxID=1746091 RepID=A0ABQ8XWU3_9EUKA|nr:ras gtpase-activating protein [Anaeramoeba flamelloides]